MEVGELLMSTDPGASLDSLKIVSAVFTKFLPFFFNFCMHLELLFPFSSMNGLLVIM